LENLRIRLQVVYLAAFGIRVPSAKAYGRVLPNVKFPKKLGVVCWLGKFPQIKYSLKKYFLRRCNGWQAAHSYAYFNRNLDDKRYVNVNHSDNDWNPNTWVGGAVSNFLWINSLPLLGGSFFYQLFLPAAKHFANLGQFSY